MARRNKASMSVHKNVYECTRVFSILWLLKALLKFSVEAPSRASIGA